jgi:hypothetical protein
VDGVDKADFPSALVRRFVLPTSLADRTANQRAQKATSDRLSSSSNPATRSDGPPASLRAGVLEQCAESEIAPAQRVGMLKGASKIGS